MLLLGWHPPLFRGLDLWMIGDSLHADFEGAKQVGWKAILVRQEAPVQPSFRTLAEVVTFLDGAVREIPDPAR